MPKYTYVCNKCKQKFDVIHSYKDKVTKCELCEAKGTVSKFLGNPTNIRNKVASKPPEVGSVVVRTIEEAKKEIELEKTRRRAIKK
tara:strand:+ start:611 stop:868 length:258 start_codon:yes stop_codon:yes gene_type:complete